MDLSCFICFFQELNKCKTELQYWRSKSPAPPFCQNCSQVTIQVQPQAIQQAVNENSVQDMLPPKIKMLDTPFVSPISIATSDIAGFCQEATASTQQAKNKRKSPFEEQPSVSGMTLPIATGDTKSDISNARKLRKVQTKVKPQSYAANNCTKTRPK